MERLRCQRGLIICDARCIDTDANTLQVCGINWPILCNLATSKDGARYVTRMFTKYNFNGVALNENLEFMVCFLSTLDMLVFSDSSTLPLGCRFYHQNELPHHLRGIHVQHYGLNCPLQFRKISPWLHSLYSHLTECPTLIQYQLNSCSNLEIANKLLLTCSKFQ